MIEADAILGVCGRTTPAGQRRGLAAGHRAPDGAGRGRRVHRPAPHRGRGARRSRCRRSAG